ncbi:hypothetical protein PV11_01115 [Exophiala sideris]|uniref:Uncharacterized protein n=1 Tax=Exophiala sideris TaxID=1016849 RepID=A0A0D1YV61_9EURO|nr:hypothetical protein PV11_01115 [Exophiala sideris]
MASLSTSVRPVLRLRLPIRCSSRRSASSIPRPKKPTGPAKSALPSSSSPPLPKQRPSATSSTLLTPESSQKQWYATKLFNQGQREIHRAPSHTGILGASYILAGSCFITSGALAFSNLWLYDETSDLPGIVRIGWRLGIITFTGIGCLALLRPINLIKSIDLVNSDNVVKLLVQVRRPVPFVRPKQYLIPPYEFRMDQTFVAPLEEPEYLRDDAPEARSILSSLGRRISQAIYYPFAATRRLMTLEGFMYVQLKEGAGKVKLDTQGTFSKQGKDLVQMGTIEL